MTTIDEKLDSLGIKLPNPPKPAGIYVPLLHVNDLVFVSGQIPFDTNSDPVVIKYKGKIGKESSLENGQDAAVLCTLNALSLLKQDLRSLDKIKQIVKISGFINCTEEFTDHPRVINPASELLLKIFGEKGKHSRIAIGVGSLPMNSSVEMDFIIHVDINNYNK